MNKVSNNQLTIKVNPLGAELSSIVTNNDEKEYLWQGGSGFWNGRSPILFPIIGRLWNDEYRHEGKVYSLSQHGFARRKEFELISSGPDELHYRLTDDEESLKMYPFPFCLEIGYKLIGREVKVSWKVINTGGKDMYFQIGAHPAFYYRDLDPSADLRGYFAFNANKDLKYKLISEKGCVSSDEYPLELTDGLMPVRPETFRKDALIFENNQIQKVSLLDKERKPYLSMLFDTPVLGLWSFAAQNCPFVCIEPWYGRCDSVNYTGEFKDRDWMQHLEPGKTFGAHYFITIE